MEINLAVLADFANVTQDGKLNIIGIFGEINPPKLPFVLPTLYIPITFVASPSEIGLEKTFRVVLLTNEGREVLRIEQRLVVPPSSRPGSRVYMNVLLGFNQILLEHSGDYQFAILVNEEEKMAVPLRVNEPQSLINPLL